MMANRKYLLNIPVKYNTLHQLWLLHIQSRSPDLFPLNPSRLLLGEMEKRGRSEASPRVAPRENPKYRLPGAGKRRARRRDEGGDPGPV